MALSLKVMTNAKNRKDLILSPDKKRSFKRKEFIFLAAILIIPTIHWLVFWLYINTSTFVLAFQTPTGAWSLINFKVFWDQLNNVDNNMIGLAVLNTVKYFIVNIAVIFPLSIVISYFLFKKIFLYKFFRIMFFFPSIITGVILVKVYTQFILPNGLLDSILHIFGKAIPRDGFLNNDTMATNTILVYSVWVGFGSNVILFGSAMSRIPESVFEAARLEGCGSFREIFKIILPLIWPTMSTLIILQLTSFFSSSGPILLFAPDGQAKTTTLSFWIFKQVYGSVTTSAEGNYGLVSATGMVFTLIWVPVILFVRWLFERIPAVEY